MGSTLARLTPGWEKLYHQVFQRMGHQLPLEEVEAAVSASWAIVMEQDATTDYEATLAGNRAWQREVEERVMESLQIEPGVREEVFGAIIEAFEDPASYELYPEAGEVLDRLQRAGYRMAIISNWSWHLPELCHSLGITSYFEHIFTSARLGYAKPNPKIFAYALEKMEVAPARAIHIGDSFSADVKGAARLGITPLWLVRPEERTSPEAPGAFPDIVRIASLRQVPDFLNVPEQL